MSIWMSRAWSATSCFSRRRRGLIGERSVASKARPDTPLRGECPQHAAEPEPSGGACCGGGSGAHRAEDGRHG
jgi:hypothetical protein